jgi:hypothetical protein
MTNHAIFPLSLCLLIGFAVGCDAEPESAPARASMSSAAEQGMWPLALPALAEQRRSGGQKSVKAKHLIAGDKAAAAWTRWVMALPYSTGPITDPTGAACASSQDGKYWFLPGTAGGSVERACEVPTGKQLVFPLLNWFAAFFPELYPDDEAVAQGVSEMVAAAASLPDGVCELTLEIDGVDVLADLDPANELFGFTEEVFDVEANDDHFASSEGFAGGTIPAITAGYYVRLKPLAPGDHVLEFGGALCSDGKVDFSTHTYYNLHVGM